MGARACAEQAELSFSKARDTQAAEAIFGHPCTGCLDTAPTCKAVDSVGSAGSCLGLPELECLSENARDISILSVDLKQLQARHRETITP